MTKSSITWNGKQINKMIENKALVFENSLQRGFVWDKKRMSLLIDSILREYPIPPIYTIKTDKKIKTPKGEASVFDVIDGKQRCLTIRKFMNNEFRLTDLDNITDDDGNEVDINNLTFDELSDEFKNKINNYGLLIYFFIDTSVDEVVEMMARMNNGKPMGSAEKTRIKAKNLEAIQKIASHPFLTENLSEKGINSYQNEDIIVKMAAILNSDSDEIDLGNTAMKPVYESLDLDTDKELSKKINAILDRLYAVQDALNKNKKKSISKKITNKTHMLSFTKFINAYMDDKDVAFMADFMSVFFDGKPSMNDDYNNACTNGTNQPAKVKARFNAIATEYLWFANEKNEKTT